MSAWVRCSHMRATSSTSYIRTVTTRHLRTPTSESLVSPSAKPHHPAPAGHTRPVRRMPTSKPAPERLTLRLLHPHDPTPSAEDIYLSALETLFPDDTQQSHGVPGQSIIYRSPRFGDVYLRIPAHPDEEGGRTLFAHYLWNAGVICAEGIERGSGDGDGEVVESERRMSGEEDDGGVVRWDKRFWDLRGLDVLELGAGRSIRSTGDTDWSELYCCCSLACCLSTNMLYIPSMSMHSALVTSVSGFNLDLADFLYLRSNGPALSDRHSLQCPHHRVDRPSLFPGSNYRCDRDEFPD